MIVYAVRNKRTGKLIDWDDRPGPMSSGYPYDVDTFAQARIYNTVPHHIREFVAREAKREEPEFDYEIVKFNIIEENA